MRITLLRAKEALSHRSPPDLLEFRLNRVCERLLTSGKFNGSLQPLVFAVAYGQLGLPRAYRTVEGVKVDGSVFEIANHWYEFGPGKSDAFGYSMDTVRDLGDGWAVIRTPYVAPAVTPPDPTIPIQDFPEGGSIAVNYTGSETLNLLIEGRDINGLPVSLNFSGKQTLSCPFARISRVHKEITDVPVTITFTSSDLVDTVIAQLEETEEEAYYRRYMIDRLSQNPMAAVSALCKRRHVEFMSDKDILPFSNLGALDLGLSALQYEAENDITLAQQYWAKSISVLNDELEDSNSNDTIPALRFLYPGKTAPRFTSHY